MKLTAVFAAVTDRQTTHVSNPLFSLFLTLTRPINCDATNEKKRLRMTWGLSGRLRWCRCFLRACVWIMHVLIDVWHIWWAHVPCKREKEHRGDNIYTIFRLPQFIKHTRALHSTRNLNQVERAHHLNGENETYFEQNFHW